MLSYSGLFSKRTPFYCRFYPFATLYKMSYSHTGNIQKYAKVELLAQIHRILPYQLIKNVACFHTEKNYIPTCKTQEKYTKCNLNAKLRSINGTTIPCYSNEKQWIWIVAFSNDHTSYISVCLGGIMCNQKKSVGLFLGEWKTTFSVSIWGH